MNLPDSAEMQVYDQMPAAMPVEQAQRTARRVVKLFESWAAGSSETTPAPPEHECTWVRCDNCPDVDGPDGPCICAGGPCPEGCDDVPETTSAPSEAWEPKRGDRVIFTAKSGEYEGVVTADDMDDYRYVDFGWNRPKLFRPPGFSADYVAISALRPAPVETTSGGKGEAPAASPETDWDATGALRSTTEVEPAQREQHSAETTEAGAVPATEGGEGV